MLFAQTGVTIKVVDAKTGDPVPNVSVKIKGTGKGGNTNSAGIYPGPGSCKYCDRNKQYWLFNCHRYRKRSIRDHSAIASCDCGP